MVNGVYSLFTYFLTLLLYFGKFILNYILDFTIFVKCVWICFFRYLQERLESLTRQYESESSDVVTDRQMDNLRAFDTDGGDNSDNDKVMGS